MTELLFFSGEPDDSGRVIFPDGMLQEASDVFNGKPVAVEFKVADKRRTGAMNGFWWGVIIPYTIDGLNDAGHRVPKHSQFWKMEIHYWLIRQVFGDESKIGLDQQTKLPYIHWPNKTPSSSSLRRLDFLDMIESARIWLLLELNVLIPEIKNAGHRQYR